MRRILYWLLVRIPFWLILGSLLLVTLLKWVPVRYTPLMLKRAFQFRDKEYFHTEQEWVSLECIAPELIEAVVSAEDARFYRHRGFDWEEIGTVWRRYRAGEGRLRGCSTISQQTAKNVFTLGTHTWARKAVECWWTVLLERIWGKRRILEVYLNVVELGPGIYGVGAASRAYFSVPPSRLDRIDAATLAACLPAPLRDQPGSLSPRALLRKRTLLGRMTPGRAS